MLVPFVSFLYIKCRWIEQGFLKKNSVFPTGLLQYENQVLKSGII